MKKPRTYEQLRRERRGGRGPTDRAYDRGRRKRDPRLARAAGIRSSAAWKSVRDQKRRLNPLCEMCEIEEEG